MLIPFDYLFKKYDIKPSGIIHIGASYGQEAKAYWDAGVRNIIFIEAIRTVYKQLCRNVLPYTGTICINACVSDKDGEIVNFNISNNEEQSSSMFEFGTHSQEHPGVIFTERTRLQTARVDSILKERKIDAHDYDFVNIDIQGAELLALKGMDLHHIRYAYIEVNEKELYKGCPLIKEIDEYLLRFNLHRVETKMTPHGWGDAFYIRKQRILDNAVDVPDHYQPKHPFAYPGDNEIDFERWYFERHYGLEGRTYLPVMWTALYCRHRNTGLVNGLQRFLDSLDRGKKYYTIVQYDDGILNDLTGLDIKVFSMSGQPMDYTLPLICQDHKFTETVNRNIFASFIGRNTHPIRNELLRLKQPGWLIDSTVRKMNEFCRVLASSVFTFCPRGYGPTSFRIKEAMQLGSIPVYISDQFIIPHSVDFNSYGILVDPSNIKNLPEILSKVNIPEKQKAVKESFEKYYTYDANFKIINTVIENEYLSAL